MPFPDLSKIYPSEEGEVLYHILYIDDKPFIAPYIKSEDKNPVYYFPAQTLLETLGVTGTYDKKKDKLIINGKEASKNIGIIGRDIKTNEKILYLDFKKIIEFLNLPVRIQATALGTSIYTRTDSLKISSSNGETNTSGEYIIWLSSIRAGMEKDKEKKLFVVFGATW
jgi:hypothetical protein